MQENLNKLSGKAFKYCGSTYQVIEIKIVNYKAVVKTNRQTFVKTESELDVFMEDIEFVQLEKKEASTANGIDLSAWKPKKKLVDGLTVFNAEVVAAESAAQKLSNKLMDVFDSLSDSPTEESYKKASAMVNVANSIVNVQMAQIKFLSLKK